MKIYLFFKKYYISLGYNAAIFLSKKGVTPNMASIGSLIIIIPLFLIIHLVVENETVFWLTLFVGINIKLVLNAIDGIIARKKNIQTQFGAYLNVGTDIGPDIFIIYTILSYIGAANNIIFFLLLIVLLYLISEYIVINFYKKQNLFFGGKESRVFFYILIFYVHTLSLDYSILLYFYIFITFIHNVGFFVSEHSD